MQKREGERALVQQNAQPMLGEECMQAQHAEVCCWQATMQRAAVAAHP